MNDRSRWGCVAVVALVAALVFTGCGGGGGGGSGPGGGGGSGLLVTVSFIGFGTQPSGQGPNGLAILPEVFVDQALEFTFDANVDNGIFGGFVLLGGQPREFLGAAPGSGGPIPYYAYQNQTLAAQSLQVRINQAGAGLLPSYVVGRHRDKPNTIVLDPRVRVNNPFGLPISQGFPVTTEFTYLIPSTNSINFNGSPALPVGVNPINLPVIVPSFTPQPGLSLVFRSGSATSPNPFPPEVVSIEAQSGAAGTNSDPISCTETFIITFSQPIDAGSLDSLVNLTVRNLSGGGGFVPGTLSVSMFDQAIVMFVPNPGYGPGPFDIEVRVGSMNVMDPPILGLAQGSPPSQLPLLAPASRVFRSEINPGCPSAATVIEDFNDTSKRDSAPGSAFLIFDYAGWNSVANPGQLCGSPISGSPLATFTGNPGLLGTRVQRVMPSLTLGCPAGVTCPQGLLSPFDSMTQFTPGNPMGGSHIMHLYEGTDLGNPRSALELVEWGPSGPGVTMQGQVATLVGTVYPGYTAWCGMTSLTAPIACAGGTGLSTLYSANYDTIPPLQPIDLLNYNPPANNGSGTPNTCPMTTPPAIPLGGGVRVSGPMDYVTNLATTSYFPFPVFNPPFDYLGTGVGARNLVLEQNILSGMQASNINRFRAFAVTPARRVIGVPKNLSPIPNPTCFNGPTNVGIVGGCDIYDMRFTFVGMVAHAQSQFYDSGVPVGTPNTYSSFSFSPSPAAQPAGTSARWELEGATAISSPTTPTGPTTGFLTYWNGTPETGMFFPNVLSNTMSQPQISNRKFFRYRVTFRNNNLTNGRQCYNNIIVGVTF